MCLAAVRFQFGDDEDWLYAGEVISTRAGGFTVRFFYDGKKCVIPDIEQAWVYNVPGSKLDYEAAKILAKAGLGTGEERPVKRRRK